MPDPTFTWLLVGSVWALYLARRAYLRGLERGRRERARPRPGPPAPWRPPTPPPPPVLTDGMSVEEAAAATGMTTDDFRRAISGR